MTVTDADTAAGGSNRLLSVACGGQTRTFGHDAAGNVTGDTRFDGDGTVFGYAYDGDGWLTRIIHERCEGGRCRVAWTCGRVAPEGL